MRKDWSLTTKRVLVVAHYFAPKNQIASVRATNFAVGLAREGWQVDVLTVKANRFDPQEMSRLDLGFPIASLEGLEIIERRPPVEAILYHLTLTQIFRMRNFARRLMGEQFGTRRAVRGGVAGSSPHRPPRRSLRSLAIGAAESWIDRGFRRVLTRKRGLREDYSAIWTTFGPRHMIETAISISDRYPRARFVMDLRDPIVRTPCLHPSERSRQIHLESLLALRADVLTLVSPHLLSDPEKFTIPRVVIPNGFEVGVMTERLAFAGGEDDRLTIYYGGTIYPAQDVTPLAEACSLLLARCDVRVQYAGGHFAQFSAPFVELGISHCLEDLGHISRPESLDHMSGAHAVAIFSWNGAEKGILTGKIFEAIAANVPVVAIVAGEHTSSALAEMLAGDPLRQVFGGSDDPNSSRKIAEFLASLRDLPESVYEMYRGTRRYARFSHSHIVKELSRVLDPSEDTSKS